MLKKMLPLLLLSLSSWSIAQVYKYQMKGSYNVGPFVEYSLEWNEERGKISGTYSDNYFMDSVEVEGSTRRFDVKLPVSRKGIHSLTFLVPDAKEKVISVGVISRDKKGDPLITTKSHAHFTTTTQKQEGEDCEEGFGELTGYCGIYAGLVTEDQDYRNKCNLLFADGVRLELRHDSSFLLLLGLPGHLSDRPEHFIGHLPVNPKSTRVDIRSRSCKPLQGVNANGDSCKQLRLSGEFTLNGMSKRFKGTYSIREEGTNNLCIYGLSMFKDD
jgi:hypothetical protein